MSKPGAGAAPAITTADIKDEMWLEIGRYDASAAPQHRIAPGKPTLPSTHGPVALPDLLGLDGVAFADAAYRALLDRPVDDVGAAYFARELAAGTSKIVLLGQLQRSAEGRQTGRSLPGLGRRYLAHRVYGLPMLGVAARLMAAVLRQSGLSGVLGRTGQQGARSGRIGRFSRFSAAQEGLERRARAQDVAIEAAMRRIAALQTRQDQLVGPSGRTVSLEEIAGRLAAQEEANHRLSATLASQSRMMASLVTQNLDLRRGLSGLEDSNIESLLALSDAVEQQDARVVRLEGLLNGEAIVGEIAAGATALRDILDERLGQAEAMVAQNRQAVLEQERRIGLMLEALGGRAGGLPAALREQDDHAMDEFYIDFEDRFRGSREEIKQRQRFYLPVLAETRAGSPGRPILDVGCGRGEFLELLREAGLQASGVDANQAMVATCVARGLDCVAEDAVARLARQKPGSLGAVTGFHVIEHLPFKTMVRLFDAALLALAPDGVAIFETPNPANLLVASRWFYLDPTHRNPLPGEMVAMIAEARGFTRVSIVELHPTPNHFEGSDPVLQAQLDGLFHGPQDYAVLARKP